VGDKPRARFIQPHATDPLPRPPAHLSPIPPPKNTMTAAQSPLQPKKKSSVEIPLEDYPLEVLQAVLQILKATQRESESTDH